MRRRDVLLALAKAFEAGRELAGFRLVHYSVQSNHFHFIVEAPHRRALSRGMHSLLIRVARALNRLWARTGKVFADRYHDRQLTSPRQVRNALAYVLNNARRHGLNPTELDLDCGQRRASPDRYSSGSWFDGWREKLVVNGLEVLGRPIAAARSWLLTVGWRRHRRIDFAEVPG